MRGIKTPQQYFALKIKGGGGAYARGRAYLRDTTVFPFWLAAVGGSQVRLIVTVVAARFPGGPLGTIHKKRNDTDCS